MVYRIPYNDDMYCVAYFSVSLALQIFLTTAIILRLLKCKHQTKSVLGNRHVKHYSLLSAMFVESALPNVICSLFFFIFSLPIRPTNGSWKNFTNVGWEVFTSIMPAVQVYISSLSCNLLALNRFILDMFQLLDHIQGRQRIQGELDR